jgi:RimJ/RimL family protein N-acetyltransferase
MTKLGAVEEGVLRRARVVWTERVIDRVIFSVLVDEWPKAKANLEQQLSVRRGP